MDIEDFEFQDGDIVEHRTIGTIEISLVSDEDEDEQPALISQEEIVGKRWYWDGYPRYNASGECTEDDLRRGCESVMRVVWTRES